MVSVATRGPPTLPEGTVPKFSGLGVSVAGGLMLLPVSEAVAVPFAVAADRVAVCGPTPVVGAV